MIEIVSGGRESDLGLLLSAPARYALSGMLQLALRPEGQFSLSEEIAASAKLPKDFLAKIFQKLTHGGLLRSKRGPSGGYALARSADKISLRDVVRCVGTSDLRETHCFLEERGCDPTHPCAIHESVVQATMILQSALQKMSLEDLLKENRNYNKSLHLGPQ